MTVDRNRNALDSLQQRDALDVEAASVGQRFGGQHGMGA
jgi:hypothetical protein